MGVPEGVLEFFSVFKIVRGERAGFLGLPAKHIDVTVL